MQVISEQIKYSSPPCITYKKVIKTDKHMIMLTMASRSYSANESEISIFNFETNQWNNLFTNYNLKFAYAMADMKLSKFDDYKPQFNNEVKLLCEIAGAMLNDDFTTTDIKTKKKGA